MVWSFCAVNVAPAWLLKTPPVPMYMLPLSLHVAAPAFASVRLRILLPLPLSARPPAASVRPLPLIVPPDQVSEPVTLNVALPVRVPPFNVNPLTVASALDRSAVLPELMVTVSLAVGAPAGVQFA